MIFGSKTLRLAHDASLFTLNCVFIFYAVCWILHLQILPSFLVAKSTQAAWLQLCISFIKHIEYFPGMLYTAPMSLAIITTPLNR